MIQLQRHIILLFLFFSSYVSISQNYINYTKKDGLVGNYVYRITQDNQGFLWFITETGISKFDGENFKNFTIKNGLPANDIWNIRITPNNRVWYFTRSDELGYIENDSVFKFKSNDTKLMNPNRGINLSKNKLTILGNPNNYVFSRSEWQVSTESLRNYKFHNRTVFFKGTQSEPSQLQNESGRKLYAFKNKLEWVNRYQLNDSLFVSYDSSYFEIVNLNTLEATFGDVHSLNLKALRLEPPRFNWSNNQLQVSWNNRLFCFDNSLEKETIYNIPSFLNSTYNYKDNDGFIWLATSGNGVYKLPLGYQNSNSFFNDKRITLIKEINSVIYVYVEKEGVYKIINNKPTLWIKEKNKLWDISIVNDKLFYTFRDYLLVEQNGVFEKILESRNNTFGRHFLNYKGKYFSEGFSRMLRFNNAFEVLKKYKSKPYFYGIFVQNDTLFSFSYKQMLYYNDRNDNFLDYKKEKINKRLLSYSVYKSQTFIGTEGSGVYLFSQGKLRKLIKNDHSIINSISVENENSIWAVSEGILLHYYKNEKEEFQLKKHYQINGFTTNNVNKVLIANDKLYVGSDNGLTIINKDEIINKINVKPYVKSINVNGKKQNKDSLLIKYDKDLNLRVNFGAINYFDDENTTFQYQLSPQQKSWISTESGEINLFNLQPDNYILRLKVTYNEIEKNIEIPIKILPQWWQTIWFRVVVILIVILFVAITFWFIEKRIRFQKNKKIIQEKQLAEIELKALRSQMNPHFVFNSLAAIQYYINNNEIETSETYLVKFSKLIRQFFELSKEKGIIVKDEVELLKNYLDIEKLRFKERLSFQFIIEKEIDIQNFIIPTMLLQPIVENAVNHGIFNKLKNGTVSINFKYISKNEINVIITDDGVGIANTQKKKKGKLKSSNVLNDRLSFINQSDQWEINYSTREAFSDKKDKGNISTFNIKKIG